VVMDFSRLKLNEGIATGDYTGLSAEKNTSERAFASSQNRHDRKQEKMSAKTKLASQPVGTKQSHQTVMSSYEADVDKYFQEMRAEVEHIKALKASKSNWREDLQEKAVDGVEREQHPYVTVMPTGDENLIQAMKQMAGEVQDKKKKLQSAGVDVNLQKEETELEEKKKECKDGYKWDEDKGKCVKKSKSGSTYIIGRGWGHHHHHDHDEKPDDDSETGGAEPGGGEGGMGEMFDMLGDMLLKEKLETGKEFHNKMKMKAKEPINPYAGTKPSVGKAPKKARMVNQTPKINVTGDMTKAVGKPRLGSSD